jgi:hypothetical protein
MRRPAPSEEGSLVIEEDLRTRSIQVVPRRPYLGWNGVHPEIEAVSARKIGKK